MHTGFNKTAASLVVLATMLLASAPVAGKITYSDLFFPLALNRFAGPYRPAPTALPPTALPTDTPGPPPTSTGTPTATRAPTQGPSPTPTLPWAEVRYPTGAETIVMQIGWTETDQPGEVWEEMNGTPYFTLYGDGRVIASHKVLGRSHALFLGQADEYTIQLWLRRLTYQIGFFQMRELYEHPRGSKPVMHVYVMTTGGMNRVELRGYRNWLNFEAAEVPDHARARALAEFVRDLETDFTAALSEPHQPVWYTILAQRNNPQMLPHPPRFPRAPVNPYAIAAAAPTAASNYVDKVVGHKFVDGDIGKQVEDIVVPVAEEMWPWYNEAAEFMVGGRAHAVGARREVPGGSLFLPSYKRAFWYRSDPGSGRPMYPLESPVEGRLRELGARLFTSVALNRRQ